MDRLIGADQIDFSERASTPVMSDTLRFVLPVPALAGGGEPLRHPDGTLFVDRHGAQIRGRGIVFFDEDDQCWETARGDGRDVVIFAPIDEAQGAALDHRIAQLASTPELLTLDHLKQVIRFAYDELQVRSAHNAPRAVVSASMTPASPGVAATGVGLHRRKASDVCRAVYLPGAGGFIGAGATPQLFKDGAVILRHGDDVRLAQPASFEQVYRFLDGRPARVAEIAVQSP